MYTYLLTLRGSNKDLAVKEFTTLWSLYYKEDIKLEQVKNVVYSFESKTRIDKEAELISRLTFTNGIFLKLWEGQTLEEIEKEIVNLDFPRNCENFAVDFRTQKQTKEKYPISELAKPIWDSMENPKVNLKNPKEMFTYFFFEGKDDFVLTYRISENNKDYLDRMPKLRPVAKPYTLKSDIARASVNLLNLKEGIVLDPFCGIGGILLEAADLKFEVIGNDISWYDLGHMKTVFDHYFPEVTLHRTQADSSTQFLETDSVDGIVTDIPYGKSSRKLGVDLYKDFLKSAKQYLRKGKRMVVIYANFLEFKQLALKEFDLVCEIDQYINKSMTRHILVLENNK